MNDPASSKKNAPKTIAELAGERLASATTGAMRYRDVHLDLDAFGRWTLHQADQGAHVGVQVARAFPLSDPTRGVAVTDSKGRELLWIEDLDELAEELREAIEEALSHREFMPLIVEILSVQEVGEFSEWQVRTDRGPVTFRIKTEDDLRRMGRKGALFVDRNLVRYLLPDVDALDRASRLILDRYF